MRKKSEIISTNSKRVVSETGAQATKSKNMDLETAEN